MQRYTNVLRDAEGNAVADATVDIFVGDSLTRATLYDGSGNPVSNPVTTNSDGVIINDTLSADPLDAIGFKATAGRYRIEGSKDGQTLGPIPDILIGDAQGKDTGPAQASVPTNADLYRITTKDVAGGTDVTLTEAEAQARVLVFTDALTASINVIVPDKAWFWLVKNDTTGSFTLTVKTSAGTGVAVPQGSEYGLRSDGVNVVKRAGTAARADLAATGGTVPELTQALRKNRLINGGFDIWQRGTSFTAHGYLADRWRNFSSGGAFTISRQDFAPGQTDVSGNPSYFLRIDCTTAHTGSNGTLTQRVESVRTLAGQRVTFSVWLKADAAKTFRFVTVQEFGTGGTPSANVVNDWADINVGTAWRRHTFTIDVPSISGKTIGTDGNDSFRVQISETSGFSAYTLDIANAQLEEGPIATPFEYRPIGEELALCQRFYLRITGKTDLWISTGYARGASRMLGVLELDPEMRSSPAIGFSALADLKILYAATQTAPTSVSSGASAGYALIDFSDSAGPFTSGQAGLLGIGPSTGWLDFDAEL